MKKNLTKKLVLKKLTVASLDAEKMNELHGGNANMSKNGGSCAMDGRCEVSDLCVTWKPFCIR